MNSNPKTKKIEFKKVFSLEENNSLLPKTEVSTEIQETNKNISEKRKNVTKNSVKKLTKEKLFIWGNFLDRKKCDVNFKDLLNSKNYEENLEKILEQKDLEAENVFWENYDNFIKKSDNIEFIEKYLDTLKYRKNSCPSDEFILEIRKKQEKLLDLDLKKTLLGYKTKDGKDAYEALKEQMKKNYCEFDLKIFLKNLSAPNSKKIDEKFLQKTARNFNYIKEQKIEQEIFETTGHTSTTLAFLDKKDFDKIISDLDKKKKEKLKKLYKQKNLINSRKNIFKDSKNFKNFLDTEEKKQDLKQKNEKYKNSKIVDYIYGEEKIFVGKLGISGEKELDYTIEKKGDFYELRVGNSAILCENLFELNNVLDSSKYFSSLGLAFLLPYIDTILDYFRKKTHFKLEFRDGINIKEKHFLQKIIMFLFDIKTGKKDLGIVDEKLEDLAGKKENYFYKIAIKKTWFKNGDFEKKIFKKEVEKFVV